MSHIKVCPKCGSTDIKIPPAGLDLRMTMPDYCMKCGNRGIFPEVEIDKVDKFRKKIRNQKINK